MTPGGEKEDWDNRKSALEGKGQSELEEGDRRGQHSNTEELNETVKGDKEVDEGSCVCVH